MQPTQQDTSDKNRVGHHDIGSQQTACWTPRPFKLRKTTSTIAPAGASLTLKNIVPGGEAELECLGLDTTVQRRPCGHSYILLCSNGSTSTSTSTSTSIPAPAPATAPATAPAPAPAPAPAATAWRKENRWCCALERWDRRAGTIASSPGCLQAVVVFQHPQDISVSGCPACDQCGRREEFQPATTTQGLPQAIDNLLLVKKFALQNPKRMAFTNIFEEKDD